MRQSVCSVKVRTLMELGDFLLGLEELPDLTRAMLEEIV